MRTIRWPRWVLWPLALACLVGCRTTKVGLPTEQDKYLNEKSDSSEYLAMNTVLLAKWVRKPPVGAPKEWLDLYLHQSAFYHWIRVQYGPGDRKASRMFLAWYRDELGISIKRRIGGLDDFRNPLHLSPAVLKEMLNGTGVYFGDPTRTFDQMPMLTSEEKYKELVDQFLTDVYPDENAPR